MHRTNENEDKNVNCKEVKEASSPKGAVKAGEASASEACEAWVVIWNITKFVHKPDNSRRPIIIFQAESEDTSQKAERPREENT